MLASMTCRTNDEFACFEEAILFDLNVLYPVTNLKLLYPSANAFFHPVTKLADRSSPAEWTGAARTLTVDCQIRRQVSAQETKTFLQSSYRVNIVVTSLCERCFWL